MNDTAAARGIWFPHWEEALAQLRLPELRLRFYRQALVAYLRSCRTSRQRATVASARQFMRQVEQGRRLGVSQLATWKEALNAVKGFWLSATGHGLTSNSLKS